MKPSDLYNIRSDILQLVIFQSWDNISKAIVDDYMVARSIKYRAESLLDSNNNLIIYIIYEDQEYRIII